MTTGEKLGPYEILAPIGAGGMGEVYRARDPRLNRDVAIKLLPPGGDKARFQTEARALAALNHPNIVAIHDVGDNYLVSELIDGSPVKAAGLRQAIDVAAQAADGLSAAHSVGIFHRDIKPQNILLTHDGRVKLIDFGLAKDAARGEPAQTLTADGAVLGTAPYMSPEQVRGQKLDARSDLFSLGVVLYEQVAGRRPFQGDTLAQTMSAVLEKEPPDLPDSVPPGLKQIIYRCLAKDRLARFQNAADLAFALRSLGASTTTSHTQLLRARALLTSLRLWQALAALSFLALALFAWSPWRRPPAPAPPLRLVVQSPSNLANSNNAGSAISPDGRMLAFVAEVNSVPTLHLRPLDVLEARQLPGTSDAGRPFWSPDSKSIAFFANGKLMRIDVAGGAPQAICEGFPGRGGTWNRDGVILFTGGSGGVLRRVSASGGEAAAITELAAQTGEDAHYYPQFLPDGKHFLYFRRRTDRARSGVYLGRLDDPDRGRKDKLLLSTQHRAVYSPGPAGNAGRLLFVRGSSLFSQPFDPHRHLLAGEPALLAESVSLISANAFSDVSSSGAGIVAYAAGGRAARLLAKRDRAGKPLGEPIEFSDVSTIALSPDGNRVASARADAQLGDAIWITDLRRNITTRFIFDRPARLPVWSPDGEKIAFESGNTIYVGATDGSGKKEEVDKTSALTILDNWSRDGNFLLYSLRHEKSQFDLWALPFTGDRKPFPVVQSAYNEHTGSFSPDGRWIAYASDETGRTEVYVQGFPEPRGKWMISAGGGNSPSWRNDGNEIIYYDAGALWAVGIQATDRGISPGKPQKLFSAPSQNLASADATTFYTLDSPPGEDKRPIVILTNWH